MNHFMGKLEKTSIGAASPFVKGQSNTSRKTNSEPAAKQVRG